MFATWPGEGVSLKGGFFDEFFTTALLLAFVFALDDQRNVAPKSNMGPFMVGMVIFGLCMSFGSVSGLAMNPARDLGPRLFMAMAGWGPGVFTVDGGYWWVPIVAPLMGGPVGAACYEFFVCVDVEEEIELNLLTAMQKADSAMGSYNSFHGMGAAASVHDLANAHLGGVQGNKTTPGTLEWTPIPARKEIPDVVGLTRRMSTAQLQLPENRRSNTMFMDKDRLQGIIGQIMRRNQSEGKLSSATVGETPGRRHRLAEYRNPLASHGGEAPKRNSSTKF